jgi:hypothetical protein
MLNLNLYGGGFQHSKSTTLYKQPKFICWNYNSIKYETTFYVDNSIIEGTLDTTSKKKYGLLLESKYIIQGIEDYCIRNLDLLKKEYINIFTHNRRLIEMDDELFKFCPANGTWIEQPSLHSKTKLVSMITSDKQITEIQKFRFNFARQNINNLDLFGRGYNPIDNKEMALNEYMFSVCIENGIYDDYFTEKILDCFACGTIPIYLGTPRIGEYFNSEGIILLNDEFEFKNLTKELYDSKINAIHDNLNAVKEFYTVEDWLYRKYFMEKSL